MKRNLSLNIIAKFAENKSIERIKKAKALYIIYSKKNSIFKNLIKKKKLNQWRRKCIELCGISENNFNSETSQIKKEKEELRNCTFKPEINRNYEINKNMYQNGVPAYQRLYTEHERLNNRKNIKRVEMENRQAEMLSFSPDRTLTSQKTNRMENSGDFFTRQEKFRRSKEKHMDRIVKDIEDDMERKFTFIPKVLKNNSSSRILEKSQSSKSLKSVKSLKSPNSKYLTNNDSLSYSHFSPNTPTHVRLYEDKFRRDRKSQLKMKKLNEENKNQSKITNINDSYYKKTQVDHSKIQQLYNDHKKNKMNVKKLQKEIDKEQGLTFKPDLYTNEKYSPNMNFNDRNQKLLEDKKNFVEIYNQIYDENLSNQKWGGGRKYTTEEFEIVNKNIQERLYSKGKEKQLLRNAVEDIDDRERFNFKSYLRNNGVKNNYNTISVNQEKENVSQISSDRFAHQSPKNISKNSTKNFTFNVNNNLLLQSSKEKDFLPKKEQIENYTFGEGKVKKTIDKNYNYVFDENIIGNNKNDQDASVRLEERVIPANLVYSSKKMNKAKKNIIIDDIDQDAYNYSNQSGFKSNSLINIIEKNRSDNFDDDV